MSLFSFGSGGSSSSGSSLDVGSSQSISQAVSQAGGQSNQNIAFADIFSQLYGQGASRALGGKKENPALQLFSGGIEFLQNLTNNSGVESLKGIVEGDSSALDNNLMRLQDSLGRLFREEINPAITSDAVGSGTLGGGRQGVAQAGAARGIAEQFSQGAASLISGDQQRKDTAATTLAGLIQQGSSLGLDNLGNLLSVGVEANTNLAPLAALSSIIGDPTVLTQSSDFSNAINQSLAESFSVGASSQRGRSRDQSFSLS